MLGGASEKGVLRPIQLGGWWQKKALRFNGALALPLALLLPCSSLPLLPDRQKRWWSIERPRFPALAHLTTLSSRYLAALRLTHSHSQSHSRSHSHSPSHFDSVCDSYFNYFLCDFCFCYSAARHIPICVFIFTFIPIQCLSFLLLLLLFCFGCRDSLFEITNAPSGTD